MPSSPLDYIPPQLATLADYERAAREFITPDAWQYLQQGLPENASAASSININQRAFQQYQWLPRLFGDAQHAHTAVTLFGQRHAYPFLFAPIAYHGLFHPQGELATAQAAAAMQTGYIVSTLASRRLEDIAASHREAAAQLQQPAAPLWFQLYLQPTEAENRALLERAQAAGYAAVVWTVDARYKRSEFALPAEVRPVNISADGQKKHTTTLMDSPIVFGQPDSQPPHSWSTLAWLKQHCDLPIVVKGVLSPHDAVLCQQHGADGVIISNHGHRLLADAVSPLNMLPSIRAQVGKDWPVLFDGGARSGSDMLKALALGADAVLVGRSQCHALAVAGSLGVAHLIHLLRAEIELTLAQLGCFDVAKLQADWLRHFASA